jgi:dipeptidyl aminopeptidase/acylaminoacyl peptidase
MKTDYDLERQVQSILREALDREFGPYPTWEEAPAAQRISQIERRGRRLRWPLRALGVAAVLAISGGGLLIAGAFDRHRPPEPSHVINGWIAYSVQDEASRHHDIFLVGLDRRPWRVAGNDSDNLDQICPAFSPDGRRLAYGEAQGTVNAHPHPVGQEGTYRSARLVIVELDPDGNASPAQTIDVGGSYPPPCATWSPDGDRLAFGVPQTSPLNPDGTASGSEVWIVSLPEARVTVLPDLLATDLEWSPDGSTLAIASGKDQISVGDALADGRIYLSDARSADLRVLDAPLGVYSLSWSPDGHRIVYETGGLLRIIDVETGNDSAVTVGSSPVQGWDPVWAPTSDTIVFRRAADSSREPPAEAVLLELGDQPNAATSRLFTSPNETPIPGVRTGFVSPERTVWSSDGEYVLYVGSWLTRRTTVVVAVPIDPDTPHILLAEGDGISGYDAYDAVAPIVNQTWGRSPGQDTP